MKAINNRDYSTLIAAATQKIPCDLTVKNVKLVNVLTGEIYPASVDVKDGVIVHVQPGEACDSQSKTTVDGQGKYLLPGFVEIHMHVESSMLTPERFGREAVLHGTTSAMTDPHEIGNVCGMEGILWMVEDAKRSPMRQFNLASSCIPADAEFETVPFPIRAPQMAQLLDSPGIYGIAEVMDSNAVITDQPFMRDILAEGRKRDVVIQGHAPYVTGRSMSAYRLAGVMNTHTVLSAEDVRECMRIGMHANMQCSSLSTMFGLQKMVKGTEGMRYLDFLSVCTDDVHAKDMQQRGHVNALLRALLDAGVDPMDAIRCCTWNPARETGFEDIGAIAPGFAADMQLVDALDGRDPDTVFVGGKMVVADGKLLLPPMPERPAPFANTVQIQPITAEDCLLKVPSANVEIAAIECASGNRLEFTAEWETLPIVNHAVDLSGKPDYCFVAVFNRFGRGTKCIAVYKHFGLKAGAMATTISHDCHNIIVAYRDPADGAAAVNRLRETGGGIVAVKDGAVIGEVCLPVAGLMADVACAELVDKLDTLSEQLKTIWAEENPSLLKLSLLALTVMPGISMTDTVMVDGGTRTRVPSFRAKENADEIN